MVTIFCSRYFFYSYTIRKPYDVFQISEKNTKRAINPQVIKYKLYTSMHNTLLFCSVGNFSLFLFKVVFFFNFWQQSAIYENVTVTVNWDREQTGRRGELNLPVEQLLSPSMKQSCMIIHRLSNAFSCVSSVHFQHIVITDNRVI